MTLETELKLIITPSAASLLPQQLTRWPCQSKGVQILTNTYYDTAQHKLRHIDMGLRLRSDGKRDEMTLKTAGQTLGGLHRRQEYNVELTEPRLDICLLPAQVWPKDCDIAALQAALQPIFSTHFQRDKWVVTYQHSEIEVVFDQGEVVAGNLSEPLYEIELELKSGESDELMAFAAELALEGGMRLGTVSKAARGYNLLNGGPIWRSRELEVMKPCEKASVEEGMIAAFFLALDHWQCHEEAWLRGEEGALSRLREALGLLRQIFVLFGGMVPRKASHALREKVMALESKFWQETDIAKDICYSQLSIQTQLALHHWIACGAWRHYLDEKKQMKLAASFKRFAEMMLRRIGATLKHTFSPRCQLREYQDKQNRLRNARLSLYILSGAYPVEVVVAYLARWHALEQAIIRQQAAEIELNRKQALKQPAFWLKDAR